THQLGRIAARLQFADRVAGMPVTKIRVALIVEVVEQPCQPPELRIAAEPRGVSAHRGLDREHVSAQRVGLGPLTKEVPGLGARKTRFHGSYPSSALRPGRLS